MNYNYFVTFTDKKTRYMTTYLMQNRSEVPEKFIQYYAAFLTQTGQKIQILKTDNALEYSSNILTQFYTEKGILHESTSPYTPEENGISERINRTLIEMAKCMLKNAKMGKSMWPHAILAATFVKNRLPHSALDGKIPFEMISHERVNLSNLKVFGCICYANNPKQKRKDKLDDANKQYIFIGYNLNRKSYKIMDPKTGKIENSSSLVFLENSIYIPENNAYNAESYYFDKYIQNPLIIGNIYENTSNIDEVINENVQGTESR